VCGVCVVCVCVVWCVVCGVCVCVLRVQQLLNRPKSCIQTLV